MSRTSLYVDIGHNPRTTEGSNVVAKKWGATVDPYLAEIPDVESGNEQCRELYFNITAERLLFRKKLLGLPVDEDLVADANIAAAHPFGEANPTFGELAVPSVRLAAAFVPLTPDEKDVTHRPVMARLYCASGLSGRYASPFTEGLQDVGIQNYNWFVAGVKDDVLKMGISGRSWLLAANLLMRIVEKNDMATARNLINNFVVTGNVEDGAISHVTIGRKPELANIKEFRNLKWIIPMKNANEMTAVPVRRIEKPATLDEAYKLIETMQNTLTRGLNEIANRPICKAEDLPDRNVLSDVLAKGADPCAAIDGLSPWGRFRYNLYCSIDSDSKAMPTLEDVVRIDRIFSYYGSMPQFFFMLAHSGQGELLKNLRAVGFDINAIDYEGETALDFAETMNDSHAKELLVECGATKRGRFLPGSSMFARALNSLRTSTDWGKKKAEQWICEALDNGLDPNETLTFSGDGETRQGRFYTASTSLDDEVICSKDDEVFAYADRHAYDFIYVLYETTTLLEALYAGSSAIVEKCLSKGIRPDVEIRVRYGEVLTDVGRGATVESPEKLILQQEKPKPYSLRYFIQYFSQRNEFPDSRLAERVLKYF